MISSHIPITPRGIEGKPFPVGYAGIPEYASFTGECTGSEYVHITDTLKTTDKNIEAYKNIMESLGIKVNPSLSNESIATEKLTSQLIDLQKKGYLLEEEESIMSCEGSGGCGITQFLFVEGEELHAHGNHGVVQNGKCSICGHQVTKMIEKSLVLYIPKLQKKDIFRGIVYPDYGEKDIKHILDRLSNTKLLISRTKRTKYGINFNERKYFLDNDLANYTVLANLNENAALKYFFTGRNIVRQVATMGILNRMISNEPFDGDIIFSPRITLKSSKKGEQIIDKSPLYFIEQGYSPQSIVLALLAAYLNPNKDVTIDSGLIYHAQNALRTNAERKKGFVPGEKMSLHDLMNTDFQRIIPSLIKKMKNIENKDLDLSCTENYVMKFINQIENLSKKHDTKKPYN